MHCRFAKAWRMHSPADMPCLREEIEMLEPMKKPIMAGLGLVSLSKEKLSEAMDDLARRGEITAEQSKKLLGELNVRKPVMAGLGLVAVSKERICEKVDELAAKGEISAEQAKKVMEKVQTKFKEEESHIKSWVAQNVEKVVAKMDLVPRKRVQELEARIAELEAKLGIKADEGAGESAEGADQ